MKSDARIDTVGPLVVAEIVTFPAEIDITNAISLGARLLAALRPGVAVIIADMTSTHFCDSSGVRQLVIADDQAKRNCAQLRVVTDCVPVLRMLQVMGLDQVLDIHLNMDSALTDSSPDGAGRIVGPEWPSASKASRGERSRPAAGRD